MQKQRKKLKGSSKKNKRQRKLRKFFLRRRRKYRKSKNSYNFYFRRIIRFFNKKKNNFRKIYIKVTQNNFFCTLTNNKRKTLVATSSGKCKIKTSKKKLRFASGLILKSFLKESTKIIKGKRLIVTLIAPKSIKKRIIKQIRREVKKKALKVRKCFFEVMHKKAFNGCREKKEKRKKRKGLRIFK